MSVTFTDRAGQTASTDLALTVIMPESGGLQSLTDCTRTIAFDETDTASAGIPLNKLKINFGGAQDTVFISPNGYVTFGYGASIASPFALEDFPAPVIAPFLADTDTSNRTRGRVCYGLSDTQLVVTWTNMGYWNQGYDKTNTFQLILNARPDVRVGAFDVTFNYGQIQWDAGADDSGVAGLAAPGALAARAGWSTGLGATNPQSFELAGSGTGGSLVTGGSNSLISGTNVQVPSRYTFTFAG